MTITAVVLTLNEAQHIERCLASIAGVASAVFVVDSGSSDDTVRRAKAGGAQVVEHPFVNHASQFNWALTQLDPATQWVLRIDADEVLTPELREQIERRLPGMGQEIGGVSFRRRMVFLGREIRHGGVGNVEALRLFRFGRGRSEERWMDEHVVVDGPVVHFDGDLRDINLNSLSWWTQKHNGYASREAIEVLDLQLHFLSGRRDAPAKGSQAAAKRWLKDNVYARLPLGLRALAYFSYRYFFRLGFLDGSSGTAFHVLQGFWYRYLVDQKVAEVKRHMAQTGDDARSAIKDVLGIDVG